MKNLLATILIVVVCVLGLSFVFSDLGPNESIGLRAVEAGAAFAVGGLIIGRLVPQHWFLAGLMALGPVVLGVIMVMGKLFAGTTSPTWTASITILLVPMAICLAAAWLGARRQLSVEATEG